MVFLCLLCDYAVLKKELMMCLNSTFEVPPTPDPPGKEKKISQSVVTNYMIFESLYYTLSPEDIVESAGFLDNF